MFFNYHVKKLINLLSEDEIKKIHEATLTVMEENGILIQDEESLKLLSDAGCEVNFKKMVAKFPSSLIEDALKKCPSEFTMHARSSKYDLKFNSNSVYFAACGGMEILDFDTGKRRQGTTQDAKKAVILCDALENIARTTPGVGRLVDVPGEVELETLTAISLRNSEKITAVNSMGDSAEWGVKMAKAVGTDILVGGSSASPLGWSKSQIEAIKLATRENLPVYLQSMASPGGVAPATLAGSIVIMNTEILGLTVLTELLRPGTGVMYSCFNMPMDMRVGTLAGGSIEFGMLTAVSAQLARFYGMASIIYQPQTDSKLLDEQTGYEKGMQWILAGMSGINLMCGAGVVDGQTLWSNAQLVIDSEMAGMVGRLIEGIEVTEDTLALDVIGKVGHFPNNYLGQKHTRDWWKREQYQPLLPSREIYGQWVKMGSKGILERARGKVRELLKEHKPVPLPREVDRELDALLKAAGRAHGLD